MHFIITTAFSQVVSFRFLVASFALFRSYCPGGILAPIYSCPNGTWCGETGLSRWKPCPSGMYCSTTTSSATCPLGKFCPRHILEDKLLISPCAFRSSGERCSLNIDSTMWGGVCNSVQQCISSPLAPQICPAGSYCEKTGLNSPSGECDGGYHCTAGSTSSRQNACPISSFCPAGSSAPTPCKVGQYCGATGLAVALNCPSGSYCPNPTTQIACAPNQFCPAGSSTVSSCSTMPDFPIYLTSASNYLTVYRMKSFQIVASTDYSGLDLSCQQQAASKSSSFSFSWRQVLGTDLQGKAPVVIGDRTFTADNVSNSIIPPRYFASPAASLSFPPNTLPANELILLRVNLTATVGYQRKNMISWVALKVQESKLVARIDGGSSRMVWNAASAPKVVLDATPSYDPDTITSQSSLSKNNQQLFYFWNCRQSTSGDPCGLNMTASKSPRLVLPASFFVSNDSDAVRPKKNGIIQAP